MATVAVKTTPIFPATLGVSVAASVLELSNFGQIASDEDRASAETLIKQAKSLRKEVEEIRFSFTKPLDEKKKDVMQLEKDLAGGLDSQVLRLTGLVNTFLKEQHKKAELERLRIQQEEQDKLKRLRAASSIAKVQTETEEKLAAVVAPTSGVRMDTKYEVTDLHQVPRELLMIDPDKVKKLLASGAEQCAGLRIWKEPARSGR